MTKKSLIDKFRAKGPFDLDSFTALPTMNKRTFKDDEGNIHIGYRKAKKILNGVRPSSFEYELDKGWKPYRAIKKFFDGFSRETKYAGAVENLKNWNETVQPATNYFSDVASLAENYLQHYANAFEECESEDMTLSQRELNNGLEYEAAKEEIQEALDEARESGDVFEEDRVIAASDYLNAERLKERQNELMEDNNLKLQRAVIKKKFYENSMNHIEARSRVKNADIAKGRFKTYILRNKKFFS